MYKFIEELENQQVINNEDIIFIENKFDFRFPDILKEYYLKYNGAKINLCCFEIDEYEYEISEIIPLKYGSCSLEKVKENDIEDGFIEESLVPIANNRGGDYYYWDKNTEEVYLIYGDDIDKNKIPDSWNDIFSESDMKNRIKKVLDIWRKYVANEFKNTIAYLERNLESVDLVEYEGKVSIIYGIKMSDGEIDYYEGGNPKELFNNDVLENSWSKVPESVKVFYEKVHNGFYYYPSKAMGLVPSEFVTYFDDDEWGIIEELEEPLKIDLKSTFGFFKNGMGGYVAIDLDNCNNNKGVLWFADSKPRYDIDFWSVVDEWTVIGFE